MLSRISLLPKSRRLHSFVNVLFYSLLVIDIALPFLSMDIEAILSGPSAFSSASDIFLPSRYMAMSFGNEEDVTLIMIGPEAEDALSGLFLTDID